MNQEIVFENCSVRTLDPAHPASDRLAVSGSEIAAQAGASARRIDLAGACILPGFNDSHVHFPSWSLARHQVRLEGARSREEALERVALGLAGVPKGGWLRGVRLARRQVD